MQVYGDIKLVSGQIFNLVVENVVDVNLNGDYLPNFEPTESGRVAFNAVNKILYLNNGTTYVPVSNIDSGLVVSLGAVSRDMAGNVTESWLNADFSFNPVPFNILDNISGLTANSSLYDVIKDLDLAITETQGKLYTLNAVDPVYQITNTKNTVPATDATYKWAMIDGSLSLQSVDLSVIDAQPSKNVFKIDRTLTAVTGIEYGSLADSTIHNMFGNLMFGESAGSKLKGRSSFSTLTDSDIDLDVDAWDISLVRDDGSGNVVLRVRYQDPVNGTISVNTSPLG